MTTQIKCAKVADVLRLMGFKEGQWEKSVATKYPNTNSVLDQCYSEVLTVVNKFLESLEREHPGWKRVYDKGTSPMFQGHVVREKKTSDRTVTKAMALSLLKLGTKQWQRTVRAEFKAVDDILESFRQDLSDVLHKFSCIMDSNFPGWRDVYSNGIFEVMTESSPSTVSSIETQDEAEHQEKDGPYTQYLYRSLQEQQIKLDEKTKEVNELRQENIEDHPHVQQLYKVLREVRDEVDELRQVNEEQAMELDELRHTNNEQVLEMDELRQRYEASDNLCRHWREKILMSQEKERGLRSALNKFKYQKK